MIPNNQMIHRIKILNQIFQHFQQITQWLPNNIDIASKYMLKAESLIELLEISDCGSTGGYDEKSPVLNDSGFKLYDRFLALVRKHDNKNDIINCCNFDVDSLNNYFSELYKLRDKFLECKICKNSLDGANGDILELGVCTGCNTNKA